MICFCSPLHTFLTFLHYHTIYTANTTAPQRPSHEHELGGYLQFNSAANYFGAEVVQGGVERFVARAVGEAKMVGFCSVLYFVY